MYPCIYFEMGEHDILTFGITAQRAQITPFIVIVGDSLLYYPDQTGGMHAAYKTV